MWAVEPTGPVDQDAGMGMGIMDQVKCQLKFSVEEGAWEKCAKRSRDVM